MFEYSSSSSFLVKEMINEDEGNRNDTYERKTRTPSKHDRSVVYVNIAMDFPPQTLLGYLHQPSMDYHAYTAPARVRALLVPLGSLTNDRFHELSQELSQAFEVRLVDVTPTRTQQFNPQGFPSGRVFYEFSTSLDNQESMFLHDFEPFRKTFVVIGITDQINSSIEDEIKQLKKIYKSSIVHCAVVFGEKQEQIGPTNSENVFHCTKQSTPETVMCDVTRQLLDELSSYISSYQHITLRSPGTLGSNDRAKPMTSTKSKRISSGSSIGLSLSSDLSSSKITIKTPTERRYARVKGRQAKILGNLLLLAGKYSDALNELTEAIVQLKAGNDHLWLGSALEAAGVCIFMLTYLGMSYQIPHALASVINSSSAASVISPSPTPTASPRSSIATTINGSSPAPVHANGSPNGSSTSRQSVELEKIPVEDLLYKIMSKVFHLYESSQNDSEDYVPNLVYCESILRFLRFMTVLNIGGGLNDQTRNHIVKGSAITLHNQNDAFEKSDILRLSQKIMTVQLKNMDVLSQTRIYTSMASLYGALGYERKKSFMLRTLFVSLRTHLNGERGTDIVGPIYDLEDVINTVLSTYGISLSTESDIKDAFSPKWMQLHKSIIKLCINVCQEIQDYKTVVALQSMLLTRYLDALTDNEQHRVFAEIQEVSHKHAVPTFYFDPFLLRGVYLVRPPNPPKKQTKTALINNKPANPVIYNPYTKTEAVEKNYLVKDELSEFLVVVQNPFAFPITINDIKIPNMDIFRNHFTVAPKSVQKIHILTKPLKDGHFEIESVTIRINDFTSQPFRIAKSQKVKHVKKLKEKQEQTTNILSAYMTNINSSNILDRVDTDTLTIDVIPAQPSLQVLNSPDPLMLLEGGTHRLSLILKNNSPVSVNALDFTVWDSTLDPLKKMLEDKSQPATEVYEFEYYLYKKSLKILSDFTEIEPFEEKTLELEVQGKRGVKQISLGIDYGHSEEGGDAFTRTLQVPITAIVHSSTDLADCDVVPLVQDISSDKYDIWEYVNKNSGAISDWCLFLLDIRNLWNKAMSIEVEYEGFKSSGFIVPMETKRLVLPIKRIELDYENLRPIPSLSGKQYVVPKISRAEDQYQREMFWYREEILKRIKGTWRAGGISGELELRAIRLAQKKLNVLKVDRVSIDIEVENSEKTGVHHLVKTGDFVTVDVKITNNSDRIIKGVIRNIPTANSFGPVERRLLFNGMLQQPLKKPLPPKESYTLQIGAVVLERGEYEWGVLLDEQDSDIQHVSRTPLRIRAL